MADAAQDLFDELAAAYLDRPGVSYGRIWHNDGLTVGGRIFAMVVRGQLVVKIPAARAGELVEAGDAVPFEPRPGRPMREWVCAGPSPDAGTSSWAELIAAAYQYVSAAAPKARRVRSN